MRIKYLLNQIKSKDKFEQLMERLKLENDLVSNLRSLIRKRFGDKIRDIKPVDVCLESRSFALIFSAYEYFNLKIQ